MKETVPNTVAPSVVPGNICGNTGGRSRLPGGKWLGDDIHVRTFIRLFRLEAHCMTLMETNNLPIPVVGVVWMGIQL